MPVDGVIFAWGGTLTPWHDLDATLGWAALSADPDLVTALRAAEATMWLRCRDEHRSGSFAEIVALAGHEPDEPAIARYHRWWDAHTIADPQAIPMLERLRGFGLRIGVLSNTLWTRTRHEQIFRRDGLSHLIDGAVYSSEIEWTKPHPEAFRAALDAVGISDPARAVFVGDRPFDDIHGAAAAGLHTILIPQDQVGGLGRDLHPADAVVQSLADIPAVVQQWL